MSHISLNFIAFSCLHIYWQFRQAIAVLDMELSPNWRLLTLSREIRVSVSFEKFTQPLTAARIDRA